MEMRGMSGELLGTIGHSIPVAEKGALSPVSDARSSTAAAAGAAATHPHPRPQQSRAAAASAVPLPTAAFRAKKGRILAALQPPGGDGEYSDRSPKGSVDVGIAGLIEEINGYAGLVTTSSCAGRVSVFLEGAGTAQMGGRGRGRDDDDDDDDDDDEIDGKEVVDEVEEAEAEQERRLVKAVPGGKGLGGRWLFVSHEPLLLPAEGHGWMERFGLSPRAVEAGEEMDPDGVLPRLVRFAFEPLILHVLCTSLRHAQPLLAAAMNAGFRESGVQSLRILEEREGQEGVMVGIRTAGLGLESVVGVWDGEDARALVNEEYLDLLVRISGTRFKANEERRERFRGELRRHMERFKGGNESGWEDKEDRARRKREEGLRKRDMLQSGREGVAQDSSLQQRELEDEELLRPFDPV